MEVSGGGGGERSQEDTPGLVYNSNESLEKRRGTNFNHPQTH